MPTQAAVVAANMQAMPGARNMPGMPMGMVDPAAAMAAMASMGGASAASAQSSRDNFVQALASVSNPSQRKAMIGEHLYAQVQARNPDRAGKITGMLLDGMEDSDLLNLLETPAELESRIQEALDVLKAHQTTGTA
jgi:polyadenylate-binding protein